MSLPQHCDYIEIMVNTAFVHNESQLEVDIILNFSKYTIQKAMLLHGIKLGVSELVTIREWHVHSQLEKLMMKLPDYSLVSGMRSMDDMSQFALTYDDAKPFFDLIDMEQFKDDYILGMKIAAHNQESITMIKNYHYLRLTAMISDLEYDEVVT